MEATRLAPAGRACSKFVWQSRFLKNWAVRVFTHSGRPAFCDNHPSPHVDYESPEREGVCWPLADSMCPNQLALSSTRSDSLVRFGRVLKCAPARRPDSSVQFFAGQGVGVLRKGWPRCCRVWASLLGAEMRRMAGGRPRIDTLVWRNGGRSVVRLSGRNSLANSKRSGINSAQRA